MAKTAKKPAGAKPTKKAAKGKRRKVNKSQAIRDYKAEHPEEGPTAIANALGKKGIKVAPAQVSNVLSTASKKTGKGKRVKKRAGRPAKSSSDKFSLGALLDTQSFVEKVGGVDAAKELLGAVEKLSK